MMHVLLSLAAIMGVEVAPASTSSSPATAAIASQTERFAGRPRARIAFAQEVRNFEIKRDGSDDILYLETRRDRWFRSELSCFGIGDPRDAQGLYPLDSTWGFDNFSRIALVSFGHRTTECRLHNLVELTPAEATEFQLIRPRRDAAKKTRPSFLEPAS